MQVGYQEMVVGANDVKHNNTNRNLKCISKFLEKKSHTNIILAIIPHRYDLEQTKSMGKE
jgi:hypothetical protein